MDHEVKQEDPFGTKEEAIATVAQLTHQRWEMVDYRRPLAFGWDIGSGPTEARCKTLTLNLKRTGMKWDPSNAAAAMKLVA